MSGNPFPIGASVTIDQLTADCHPTLARLRAAEPVSWLPPLDGWLVTGRDLAIEVMRDAGTFTVDDPRFSTARVIGPSMLSLDGVEHQRHRRPFVDPFRLPSLRNSLATFVSRRARELVEGLAAAGEADLRAGLAAPLAIDTMKQALSLPGVESGDLLAWYDGIVGAVHAVTEGEALPAAGNEAYLALHVAVSSALADSPLLAAVAAAGTLTVDEIVSNVAVLLFGGVVTSESATAIALQHVLGDSGLRQQLLADLSLVAAAVEESFRLEPSAAVVDRYATRPVTLGGAEIATGDLVRVSLTAANRDPELFANPDGFDLLRPNQHVTFARGPHACLGIHLARLETAAAVSAALEILPDVRLDEDRREAVTGLVFRAPASVRARWRARSATDIPSS